jgi:bifunctional non-homologous end joining protein LigD
VKTVSKKAARKPRSDPLERYRVKRDFDKTPEPKGALGTAGDRLAFVIQKHAATRLHYDFRLELDGVMLSWAVPKGPSYDPKEKRMAVQVEDHPISYNQFEGTIPRGQYGAGTVIIWDRGTWQPVGDPRKGLAAGKLLFTLQGSKLMGLWELVRIGKPGDRQIAWLLFKKHDEYERAKADYDVVSALPDSVVAKPLGVAARPRSSGSIGVAAVAGPLPATGSLAAAVKAELPAKLSPQLATLTSALPRAGDWIFEIKFDGYRMMTRIEAGVPRLFTRRGLDWTSKMPGLAKELAALGLSSAWLDGEIVVLGENGIPDFNALQNALERPDAGDLLYFLFDAPFFEGYDLRNVALAERRGLLKSFLAERQTERIRFSADFEADPASILQSARRLNLEGLIAKRSDAPYVSQRTETWLKLKSRRRQEFVIGGFVDRGGDRHSAEIGSVLLGVYDAHRKLVFVGGLGTGWDSHTASDLKSRLVKIEADASPFSDDAAVKKGRWTKRAAGTERWVKPLLVAEVSFADWTPDGQLRHAVFEGLRADKPSKEVIREYAMSPAGGLPLNTASSTTVVSNPQRVVDASTGLTKLDVIRYYESVAEWMVPHLKGRPCSLVRAPTGIAGQLFFQKHLGGLRIPQIKELDPALWPAHESLLEVPTATAIAGAAQMNVIEFHTWNSTIKNIDKPDRVVFDLDPGDGVPWKRVLEAAALTRSFLKELGLDAWLKTSGGKGLHIVVPLAPRYDWATVKDFSRALVERLAKVIPDRFVAKSGPSNRVNRIFVDYLRNSHGATTAAAYSVRARPGLGVSMPVPWEMLDSLKGGSQWTIVTAREHLSFHGDDPWAGYWKCRQSLTRALKLLEVT